MSTATVQNMSSDDLAVQRAGFVLIFFGVLNITISALLLATGVSIGVEGAISNALIYGGLIYGGVNITLGWYTLENSYNALVAGFVLILLNLIAAIVLFNIVQVILSVIIAIYLNQGRMVLENANARVDRNAQTDALTSYYHHLIPILVHIMKADGHADRRERRKLLRALDGMSISRYEQNRLVERSAKERAELDVDSYVSAYLTAARNAELTSPEHHLLLAALAVASADGILVDEEASAIERIARAAGVPKGEAQTLIEQERSRLETVDLDRARSLMGVDAKSSRHDIDKAYRVLVAEFEAEAYGHLGTEVANYASERKKVVDQAYQLLLEPFQEMYVEDAPVGESDTAVHRGEAHMVNSML